MTLGADQTGLAQHLEVIGNRGLGEIKQRDELLNKADNYEIERLGKIL